MVDKAKCDVLNVFLQDRLVGKLMSARAVLSFQYDPKYLKSSKAQKLSIALPLRNEPFDHTTTSAFFSGLLPDEIVRVRLARFLGLSAKNTFALLKAIGGECAGAVSLHTENEVAKLKVEENYRLLDEIETNEMLQSLDKRPFLAGEHGVRISGAGAQNKLMIAFVNGQIAIPLGNTASTHIIKPAIKGLEDSVFNEFFCMTLAKNIGLPVPSVHIIKIGEQRYYVVERYDRVENKTRHVLRLHQEDFCQALHLPPDMKYESEGGPSLVQCFELLDQRIKQGLMAGRNKLSLLHAVIYNFLIGNGDAHGKNFSLLYENESESLAPLYDLLSTEVYFGKHKTKMAMKIVGKYKFKDVQHRHWVQFAELIGMRSDFVIRQLNLVQEKVVRHADSLIKQLNKSEDLQSDIYQEIISIINSRKFNSR